MSDYTAVAKMLEDAHARIKALEDEKMATFRMCYQATAGLRNKVEALTTSFGALRESGCWAADAADECPICAAAVDALDKEGPGPVPELYNRARKLEFDLEDANKKIEQLENLKLQTSEQVIQLGERINTLRTALEAEETGNEMGRIHRTNFIGAKVLLEEWVKCSSSQEALRLHDAGAVFTGDEKGMQVLIAARKFLDADWPPGVTAVMDAFFQKRSERADRAVAHSTEMESRMWELETKLTSETERANTAHRSENDMLRVLNGDHNYPMSGSAKLLMDRLNAERKEQERWKRVIDDLVTLAETAWEEAGKAVSMQAFGWLEDLTKKMRALRDKG